MVLCENVDSKIMPIFHYKAKEGPTKVIDGGVEANSLQEAVAKISRKGLTPLDVWPASPGELKAYQRNIRSPKSTIKKCRFTDVVIFTRQISDLADAAVPILRALQIVANQTPHPYLKDVIQEMQEFVKNGGAFSEALGRYPDIFSSLYVNMIRTGEVGGHLEAVLRRLADYLEKEQETITKVRLSLAYPLLILIVGVIVVLVLLTFVIPRLSVIFDDFDQALPWPTVILMNISGFFARYWWVLVGVTAVGGVNLNRWLRSPKGRAWFDTFKINIPLLGEFVKVVEIGRFARTLGTLVEGGVAITTALHSVWATIGNTVLRDEIKNVSDEVTNGASLKDALKRCSFFPEAALNMIAVGEETGRLERGLHKIADTFERKSDQTIKTMTSLLGPIVLIVIVLIVGFVVIAMLLPIFQMNLLIQ